MSKGEIWPDGAVEQEIVFPCPQGSLADGFEEKILKGQGIVYFMLGDSKSDFMNDLQKGLPFKSIAGTCISNIIAIQVRFADKAGTTNDRK